MERVTKEPRTRERPRSIRGHLTVPEAAHELGITASGVYKLIQRGRLKAIRQSERRTFVPEPALRAYQARLNGERPVTNLPDSDLSTAEARRMFKEEFRREPEEWLAAWKADDLADTAENNRTAIRALAVLVEPDPESDAQDPGSKMTGPPSVHSPISLR